MDSILHLCSAPVPPWRLPHHLSRDNQAKQGCKYVIGDCAELYFFHLPAGKNGHLCTCIWEGVWSQFLRRSNQLKFWWHGYFRTYCHEIASPCLFATLLWQGWDWSATRFSLRLKKLNVEGAAIKTSLWQIWMTLLSTVQLRKFESNDSKGGLLFQELDQALLVLTSFRFTSMCICSFRSYDRFTTRMQNGRLFCLQSGWMLDYRWPRQNALHSRRRFSRIRISSVKSFMIMLARAFQGQSLVIVGCYQKSGRGRTQSKSLGSS